MTWLGVSRPPVALCRARAGNSIKVRTLLAMVVRMLSTVQVYHSTEVACILIGMGFYDAWNRYSGAVNALLWSSAAALLLFLARSVATGTARFSFMAWNLVLSLSALLVAAGLVYVAQSNRTKLSVVVFAVWLFLLPNTFYMLTDFVHVTDTGDINMLFDIVMIGFFAMNGFVHGLLSVFMAHRVMIGRFGRTVAAAMVALILLASSFAVDMGRYLRWNSWDILVNPQALLFDVTNTLLNPTSYDRSFLITGVFFVTTSSLYLVCWQLAGVQWDKVKSIHKKP